MTAFPPFRPGEIPPPLPTFSDVKFTRICDLKPFMKSISCKVMVIDVVEDGKAAREGGIVYTMHVADESGSIYATFWNEVGACIKIGDVLIILDGFVTMFKNTMRFACKVGKVVRIGHLDVDFVEEPNMSSDLWLPNPDRPHELIKQDQSEQRTTTTATTTRLMKS